MTAGEVAVVVSAAEMTEEVVVSGATVGQLVRIMGMGAVTGGMAVMVMNEGIYISHCSSLQCHGCLQNSGGKAKRECVQGGIYMHICVAVYLPVFVRFIPACLSVYLSVLAAQSMIN